MAGYYGQGGGLPHISGIADRAVGTGDAATEIARVTDSPLFWAWNVGHFVALPALVYHGYKRNDGSLGWALVWGIFGSFAWPITIPIAFAQGFAKRKVKSNTRRRRSSRRRRTSR